jgi:hypothetical protein
MRVTYRWSEVGICEGGWLVERKVEEESWGRGLELCGSTCLTEVGQAVLI